MKSILFTKFSVHFKPLAEMSISFFRKKSRKYDHGQCSKTDTQRYVG